MRGLRRKRRKAARIRDAKRRATGKPRYTNPEKERVRKQQRYQQQTAERLAQGLCPKCGNHRLAADSRLCGPCGEKRRKSERARYAAGKAADQLYGGKNPEMCRRIARKKSKERFHARIDAGLCARCGHRPLVKGSTTCESCGDARRAADREQYAARRAEGRCGRCGGPTGGGSRCGQCAEFETGRHQQKNAAGRKRYARRRDYASYYHLWCSDRGRAGLSAVAARAIAPVVSPAGGRGFKTGSSRRRNRRVRARARPCATCGSCCPPRRVVRRSVRSRFGIRAR